MILYRHFSSFGSRASDTESRNWLWCLVAALVAERSICWGSGLAVGQYPGPPASAHQPVAFSGLAGIITGSSWTDL